MEHTIPGGFDCLAVLIRVVDQRVGGVEAEISFFPQQHIGGWQPGTKNNALHE